MLTKIACQPTAVLMALSLFLAGCASDTVPTAATEPSAALAEAAPVALAPRPFTAEQIAEHMPVGKWRRYLMEPQGEPGFEELSTVLLCQGAGMTMESRAFELDGTARGEPQRLTANWVDLRDHASWPAEATVIHETQLALPSGTFDCWRYTVTAEVEGVSVVSRFYFSKAHPGAPVRYEEVRDGVRVFRMSLLASGVAGES